MSAFDPVEHRKAWDMAMLVIVCSSVTTTLFTGMIFLVLLVKP